MDIRGEDCSLLTLSLKSNLPIVSLCRENGRKISEKERYDTPLRQKATTYLYRMYGTVRTG